MYILILTIFWKKRGKTIQEVQGKIMIKEIRHLEQKGDFKIFTIYR